MLGTRLDFTSGPTAWHGLSLVDVPPLETAWCFAVAFLIFILHWAIYRFFLHGLRSYPLRCFLAGVLVISYILAVSYFHPCRPYWIRELSVMLSQLFAWKVADMALLRYEEPLPYGFLSWLLFDVLVLRPPLLVLPHTFHLTNPSTTPAVPENLTTATTTSQHPSAQLHRRRRSDGVRRRTHHHRSIHPSAGDSMRRGQPDELPLQLPPPPPPAAAEHLAWRCRRNECTTAKVPKPQLTQSCTKPPVVALTASLSPAVVAAGGAAVAVVSSSRRRRRVSATASGDFSVRQQANDKMPYIAKERSDGIGDGSSGVCSSRSSNGGARVGSSDTYSSITSSSTGSEGGCSIGGDGCSGGGGGDAAKSRGTITMVTPTSKAAGIERFRMAVAASWGPMRDFLWTYNACEAINAFLMHRRSEDILEAPLPVQVWLSACFATTLYLHLSYFFYSMEMLWLIGFALGYGCQVGRWGPLFNSPTQSTSPVDFWNNRWHQAFRWWWTRLVFNPVRSVLHKALDRLELPESSHGGGSGGGNQRSANGFHNGALPSSGRSAAAAAATETSTVAVGDGGGLVRRVSHSKRHSSLASWLRSHRRTLLVAIPTVAVFAFSAVFHETLLWINFGKPTGEQAAFFMIHAGLVLLQRGIEKSAPKLTDKFTAAVPAPLRAAVFMSTTALTSVLFFRPWFRSSYHRELRVLLYGPAGWAVRVWILGMPPTQARLFW
ncbi:hypothetical protein Vretimale_12061 [Volvox reticuliferus]|uniref:Wax synthase domain-containing protein n=1 Tax=Volvox reticuliferus TaxID=1737510 RepID=A0A8J4GIS9_9CHLO|nr:hypothetical protein Vretifemale_9540 [Volvox reticuliferus]GIM08003.1 hypothetical protein Vretimale_12061 [Volvox reticuliferus]